MNAPVKTTATAFFILFFSITGIAQSPQLMVDGKTNNGVSLQSLHIEIKVCGNIARTTWQMVFKNNTSRILEGTVNFPMKEGISVSRYALDINGKMREAVPVDRGKGTEVFEAVERRRIDPGLLEKVEGNIFRTRIYPINVSSTRTVLIGYEEQLSSANNTSYSYAMPLNLKDTIEDFKLEISVMQSVATPVFEQTTDAGMKFDRSSNMYIASIEKHNYVPEKNLSFSIPRPGGTAGVMLQEFENKYYYLINTAVDNTVKEKILPHNITLLWDASLSGSNRDIKKETALLDAYFKKTGNASVTLLTFGNKIYSNKKYELVNGNWDVLQKDIDGIVYDGATNLGCINTEAMVADEFILLSDGRQTFGSNTFGIGKKRVYCISSAASADFSNLQYISMKSGGQFINLQQSSVEEAIKNLTTEPLRFLERQLPNLPHPFPLLITQRDRRRNVVHVSCGQCGFGHERDDFSSDGGHGFSFFDLRNRVRR